MEVGEVMVRAPKTCREDATLADAASIMSRHDCACVPVVDEVGRLVGVITDRDICLGALAERASLFEAHVAVHMTTPGHRCSAHHHITAAFEHMRALGVEHLVVTDDGDRVVGLLSFVMFVRHGVLAITEGAGFAVGAILHDSRGRPNPRAT